MAFTYRNPRTLEVQLFTAARPDLVANGWTLVDDSTAAVSALTQAQRDDAEAVARVAASASSRPTDVRAAGLRLLKVSDASELVRLRPAPQTSTMGAVQFNSTGPMIIPCTGTPEGAVTAPVGSIAVRTDGGASTTLYVKESGVSNTGWIPK